MKKFIVTYRKAYKKDEQDCVVYATTQLLAAAEFRLTHPLCVIISIEEG
jgi:hypothetical protein